jgi:hypothetical protein
VRRSVLLSRHTIPAKKILAIGIVIDQPNAMPNRPLFAESGTEKPLNRRRSDPEPLIGPVVKIVAVTAVVSVPAASVAGLKLQLVSAGKFPHAKVTVPLKVAPPTGAAEKLYVALCPASTVTVVLPVLLQLTSVPTVKLTPCECVSVPSVA